MTGGELAALAFLLLGTRKGASSPQDTRPTQPPPVSSGGGSNAEDLGKLAGTGLTLVGGVLGKVFAGGGGSGGIVAGAGGGGGLTVAGASTTAESGAFLAAGSLTLGSSFAFAWAVYFVLQFVMINVINSLQTERLRWRDKLLALNMPFRHLHFLEVDIVSEALKQLGLPCVIDAANDRALEGSINGEDPRLTITTQNSVDANTVRLNFPQNRRIIVNPFTGPNAEGAWLFVQLAARLVAARYAFDLGVFARNFFRGWYNVSYPSAWGASELEVWNYPLAGGGVPPLPYATLHKQFQALGPDVFPIDQALAAAHLSALLHVASMVASDPAIYSPIDWNPAGYSLRVYEAMGLSIAKDGVSYAGDRWLINPAKYNAKVSTLWLNVDDLKAGKPMQPFMPAPAGVVIPTPAQLTCLVAIK